MTWIFIMINNAQRRINLDMNLTRKKKTLLSWLHSKKKQETVISLRFSLMTKYQIYTNMEIFG